MNWSPIKVKNGFGWGSNSIYIILCRSFYVLNIVFFFSNIVFFNGFFLNNDFSFIGFILTF